MQDIPKDTLIKAQEGNIEAFEEVYKVSSGYVYNISYRMTNNHQDAQEVTQDVFLKIYKNLRWFRFSASFKTWIYRITVNTAINTLKRKKRYSLREIEYDDTIKSSYSKDAKKEMIEKESKEALIKSMLSILSPKQKKCLVLRDIEGLSYKEIAQTLKININTVRSRLKRARFALLAFRKRMVCDEM